MNAVAIVSIVFGLLIIVTRGPLIFAPAQMKNVFLKIFQTPQRVRGVGIGMAVLGVAVLLALSESVGTLAVILSVVAWSMLIAALAFMAPFPGAAKSFLDGTINLMSDGFLRVVGAIAVVIGILLIYAGATA